ncbi:Crotonobetainyl-CoA:carnitine CoA-transferase CaiB [Desulfacinum hydrothermale DSM 13146]|uniref:Crotonobetainyl-CoA:carnitine CoA-transferase CaiB n=1 Tax=Desulfacinum hydrothermale DSM 13146 TaxID=1121390 RepID=A0A1W1XSS6_9BACT|nr:CoA transferase [Desulfacinum hydrothermale]SMC27019.1 Crotonobetainyl-CoA:carnitine CoA-transferase CaiB [Desulfacinum hydrothermale DSM 13146]
MKDQRVTRIEDLPGPKSQGELEEMKMPYEEWCRKVFAPGQEKTKPESLKGIRWLSTTMYIFTPHSVANLAELGAECIKIEMPRMGDPMRHTSPFNECYLYPLHDSRPMTGTGLGFTNANSNEYYITMDYHVDEMKEAFYRLVKLSDGLTECYRPGTFDRWKQSYRYLQELNPRFIYVWGGGFGYGPKVFGGSYDILGQAHAGLASVTGFHEDFGGHCTKHSNWCIDWYSGTQITVAMLAALYWRRKTGLGTMIEFSQVQAATRCLGYAAPLYGRFGIVRQRWGNWDTQLCVHGIILCGKSDYPDEANPQLKYEARYVVVSAFNDPDFKELCAIVGRNDLWDQYKTLQDRVKPEAQMVIYKALEDWAADKTRSEVVKTLTDAGLLAMPVMNDKEVYESEHFRQRGTIRWLDDPVFGDVLIHSGYSCGLMSKTPRRVNWIWRPVGADNVKIYHEMLGYPMSQVEQWYEKNLI